MSNHKDDTEETCLTCPSFKKERTNLDKSLPAKISEVQQ